MSAIEKELAVKFEHNNGQISNYSWKIFSSSRSGGGGYGVIRYTAAAAAVSFKSSSG